MIFSFMRTCPSCQKSFVPIHWLCDSCLHRLNLKIQIRKRPIGPSIEHFYLMEWDEDPLLRTAAHSLKGGRPLWAFDYLAAFYPKNTYGPGSLYYPSKGSKDHAYQLAESLGRRWGKEIQAVRKGGRSKQALLNLKQRDCVQFEPLDSPSKRQAWVVDDIVTTGATAKSLYRALGQPRKMTLWSLFYRKNLRS